MSGLADVAVVAWACMAWFAALDLATLWVTGRLDPGGRGHWAARGVHAICRAAWQCLGLAIGASVIVAALTG